MNSPLFSVVTVTYNASASLPVTLQSVYEQDFTGYEHLVVDGASKDDTQAVVRACGNPGLLWFSEPDGGLYDAMNKGIRRAKGEYLIFLNSGDSFHRSTVLSDLAALISQSSVRPDILYGETAVVGCDRAFIGMRRLKAPEKLSWKSFRRGMLVCHQAFVVRRELAPEYNLTYRFSADFDWCIRCMKVADQIVNSRLILVDYLNEGLTTQNHNASLKERFRIMSGYYGVISVSLYHLWFAVRFYFSKWILGRV